MASDANSCEIETGMSSELATWKVVNETTQALVHYVALNHARYPKNADIREHLVKAMALLEKSSAAVDVFSGRIDQEMATLRSRPRLPEMAS